VEIFPNIVSGDSPTWENLPPGVPNTVVHGTWVCNDLRGTNRYIYYLGSATSFWRYDTVNNGWQQLASPPGGTFGTGNCLVYDPSQGTAGYVWALIANATLPTWQYYDIALNIWTSMPPPSTSAPTTIDSCDDVTGWVQSANGTVPDIDSSHFKEGTGSVQGGKSGVGSTLVAYSKTVTSFNATGQSIYVWVYVADKTELSTGVQNPVFIFVASSGSNYYYKGYATTQLNNGWNLLGGILTGWSTYGSPAIAALTDLHVYFYTNNATDLIAHGNLKMDWWRRETPLAAAANMSGCHTCSMYDVSGNDDYIYFVGNTSTTFYRYSISGGSWTTLTMYERRNWQ
jgi:hypothetical protein